MHVVRPNIHVNSDAFHVEIFLNKPLNEGLDLAGVKQLVSKLNDKKKAFHMLIKKFNESQSISTKKYIAAALVIIYLSSFAANNSRWSKPSNLRDISVVSTELAKADKIDASKIASAIENPAVKSDLTKPYYVNVEIAKTSPAAKEMIKKHEKLKLTAYSIGDGMITIGYGHAKPKGISKYKLGDKITEKQAQLLFEQDVKDKEDGIKRMFAEWKKQNIDINVNQNMFDAMVSMAFNMGVTGFRKSEFVKNLKKGNAVSAAEKIKTTNVDPNFPGLKKRRAEEHSLFIKK